ncbi:FAD-dependent oxidoreductase [Specibacter cremeus]|uniref:oxidoreductase n=1 Tax=Specibacter cremeus TaxID=1629051 RepID=UPI000F7761C8|nr:FAD-dependent oxidoreductase [Specibacter cremeus]
MSSPSAETAGFDHALSPGRLGPVTVRNRIFSSAHQTSLVKDHLPTDELRAYHEERAKGGIGAIFVEATAVHPSGLLTPKTLGGYLPEIVEPLAQVADAVHRHGAKLFVQLFHGGREQIASAPRAPALAPSAVPTARFHVEPRALTEAEITDLVAGYAASARHMASAGLDGVEISASHAYLPAQFFSARSNLRTDAYGGGLRARLKFLLDIIAAVRESLPPEKAVGVRLALDELSPGAMDHEECARIAEILAAEAPIDFISFVLGDSATYQGSSFIAPRPASMPGSIIGVLQDIRARLDGRVAVLATTQVLELADADAAVADGSVDFVGMTRAHIADPHLVRKSAAGIRPIPCIGCNVGCIGHYHAGLPIACITNISTGRERTRPQPAVAGLPAIRRTLAVVGAGPAGVAAAMAGAGRGLAVTLYEREAEIGGQLRLAGGAPDHRAVWSAWRDWAGPTLEQLRVLLRLSAEPDAADLAGFDAVVLATGARPYRDPAVWAAWGETLMLDAWTALEHPEEARGTVLVADWGGDPSGLDCAEVMLQRGHRVYYAYAGPSPTEQIHQYQRNGYLERLDVEELTLLPHLGLVAEDGRLAMRNVFSGKTRPLPPGVDTVIAVHGRVPHQSLPAGGVGPVVEVVGDALGPRSLEEATLEGTLAAERLVGQLNREPEAVPVEIPAGGPVSAGPRIS